MARGDHIYVYRNYTGIFHHGIDCGDGTVIHYSEEIIDRTTIQQFSQGKEIYKRLYEHCDSSDLVIRRAESRLGESKYHLIFNNCEHFASWCKTGREESEQVKQFKPLLDVLNDFLNWRMADKERQYYQNLIDRNNYIIRKLNHELTEKEAIVPQTSQQKAVSTDNFVHHKEETKKITPKTSQQKSVSTDNFASVNKENSFQTSQADALITDKFDYRILQALLTEGCWQEADELTTYAMLKITNRDYDRYFRPKDITNFPREDILIIDKLWLYYSQQRFGFSVQKKIYQTLGGTQDYQHEVWEDFSTKVGWRINDIPLSYDQLCFGIHAPKGHLPHGKRIGSEVIGFLGII